jgi:D-tyrosyl-tRNA(Tyr) deacylase
MSGPGEGRVIRRVYPAATHTSQLPPHADTAKGSRPSFDEAAPPEEAEELYERFCEELRAVGVPVETGVFGAQMQLELVNDGLSRSCSRSDPAAPGRIP